MSNGTSVNGNNQTGMWQVGSLPVQPKVAKTTQLDPQVLAHLAPIKDELASPAAKQGQATVANFVESPKVQNFKTLLAQKKYDDLAALVGQMSYRELQAIDLNDAEIRDLAKQFGANDLLSAVSYSGADQLIIRKMIMYTDKIAPDQKINLLLELGGGAEGILDYLNQASLQELGKLSASKRQALVGSLLNDASTLGTVGGALKELVVRRGMGQHQKEEDVLTSKLLRTAASEYEVKQLLESINSYERDDVAFQYVTAMSASQLGTLSDDFKIYLLKNLVDSSVSLPFMDVDLNSIGNLDESLGMTFKEHTKAAVLLYKALSTKAQQRKDVQQTVQKSDDFMAELAKIEQQITQAVQSKTLDLPKIDTFKAQLQQFKSSDPKVQQKIETLLKTLDGLKQELSSASQIQGVVTQELSRVQGTAKELQQTVDKTRQKLTALATDVTQTQAKMPALEKQLMAQYKQAFDLRQSLTGLGEDYQKLLGEYQQVLESQGTTGSKVAKLEQLSRKLAAAEASANQLDTKNTAIGEQLNTLEKEVKTTREAFDTSLQLLTQQETQYQAQLKVLTTQLSKLQASVKLLDTLSAQAQQQLQQAQTNLPPGTDLKGIEQELATVTKTIQTYKHVIQTTQTQLKQELVPQSQKYQDAKAKIQASAADVEQQLDALDHSFLKARAIQEEVGDAVDEAQAMLAQLRSEVQDLSQKSKTATAADIKKMLTRLNDLKTQLKSSTADASDIQTLSQEMAQLQSLLTDIQTQMKTTQGTVSELMGKMKDVQDIKKSLQKELQKSQKSVESAQASIAKSQQTIATINTQLPALKEQLSAKQKEADELEKQLATTYTQIEKSKQTYAKSREAGAATALWGSISHSVQEAGLIANIKSQEEAQVNLKKQLDTLKTDIKRVEADISTQQKSLQDHKTQLGKDQTQLQQLKGESDKLLAKLNQSQQQNSALVAKVEKFLANPPQSDNKVLQTQLQSLRSKYQELTGLIPIADALGKSHEETWSGSAELASQTNAMQAQLDQGIQDLQTQKTVIGEAKQDIKEADQEFKAWEQKVKKATQDYQALERLLQSGHFDKDAVLLKIDELALRSESRGLNMETLRTMALNIQALKAELKQSETLYSSIKTETQATDALLTKARSEQQQIQSEVAALLGTISAQEGQVADIHKGLLEQQKKLLDQRKQLGIGSGEYQQLLKEYETLLQSNAPMATKGQRLDQLETKLGQLEQDLIDTQSHLSDQLLTLNGMKEKINGQRDRMIQAAAQLQGLTAQLEVKESRLGELIQQIEVSNGKLAQHRNDLQKQITALENLPYKSTEDLQLIAELKTLMGQVDERIGINQGAIHEAQQKLEEIALVKYDISQTLELVKQAISRLNLLVEKIEQVTHLAKELLGMVNDMLEEVKGHLKELKQLRGALNQLERPNQSIQEPTSDHTSSSLTDKAMHSLRNFFKGPSGGSSFKASAQLEVDREKARESRQAEFLKALKELQQNEERRQRDHKYKKEQQAMLDDVTERMIDQVYAGGSNTSTQNIMGLQTKSA